MSALHNADKELFAEDCQLKNFARLLLRIAQQVHEALNNPKLLDANFDAWGPMLSKNEYDVRLSKRHTENSLDHTESNGSRIIEKADLCFFFWQLIRNCRELILKGLVLINIVEKPKFQLIMNHTLETASKYYENQEIFRKFGQQFNSIQWPPHGWGEPPCPPYAIDVSIDILCGKGNYRRLPKLLEEVVKQVGEVETSIGLALDEKEGLALERRIKVEVTTMWALSKCKKKQVQFLFKNGMIFFVVPNEFCINAIFDLQRFQVIKAKILVGATTFGIEVSPFLNTGFKNFLDQAIGLIEMRYHFAIEKVKNKLREMWNANINTKMFENDTCDTAVRQNLNDEWNCLEKSLISLLCCEDGLVNENLENNNLFDDKQVENIFCSNTNGEHNILEEGGTNIKTILTQNDLNPVKKSGTNTFPDYFFECFRLGRWVSGSFILTLLRDQALRACSFSSVYPGCIKTYNEIGKKEFSCFNSENLVDVNIKALDLYIVPYFDPTCGGLLSPLLCLLFEVPSLEKEIDQNFYLRSSLLEDNGSGYTMLKKISTVTSGIQHYELSGSGSILRIGLEILVGDWELILWPLTPILEILKFVTRTHADVYPKTQKSVLLSQIKKNLLFDASYVYDALLENCSYKFLQNFNAKHLELSLWTRHAASLLATLTLATIASYIKLHMTSSNQIIEVYLRNELDTFTTSRNKKFTSLDCIFFKRYVTHLHVDPFDGKLCISFSTRHKKNINWIRIGYVEYDSQIATAISMGSLGPHGFLRLLPYLTYIAFLQYLEETCSAHKWETDFLLQNSINEHLSNTLFLQPQNNENSQFIEHGYRFPTSSFIDADIGKNKIVSVVPPPDNVHMTELLYTLRNNFRLTSSQKLSRSFCFVYKREHNLCLCIYGNTTAQYQMESVKLVVMRLTPSVEIVTFFELNLPPLELVQEDDIELRDMTANLESWISEIKKSLEGFQVHILHLTSVASLLPKEFPLQIVGFNSNKNNKNLLSLLCLPSEGYGKFYQRDFGWCESYFDKPMTFLPVQTEIFCDTNNILRVQLKSSNGARLPAFQGASFKNECSIPFGENASVQLNSFTIISENLFHPNSIILKIEEACNISLRTAYAIMANKLAVLGFFLRGCRELQRLQALRNDVTVLAALPSKLVIAWLPWLIKTPFTNTLLPRKWETSKFMELPPVYFFWGIAASDFDTFADSVEVSTKDILMTISNSYLQPVLLQSKSILKSLLECRQLTSPWLIMRYILLSFELHASVTLLENGRQSSMYKNLEVSAPLPNSLLEPGYLFWCRGKSTVLGKEELFLDVEKLAQRVPSQGTGIVSGIHLYVAVNMSENVLPEYVLPIGSPLAILFHAKITVTQGFQAATDVIIHSLNAALNHYASAFSAIEQESVVLPLDETLSPAYFTSINPIIPQRLSSNENSTKNSAYSTETFKSIVPPGRLLTSFLLPMMDALVVWLNALTATSRINPRNNVVRSGVLCFTNSSNISIPPAQLSSNKKNSTVLNLGSVQWQQAPNGLVGTAFNKTASQSPILDSSPQTSSVALDKSSYDQRVRTHIIELLLIPSSGSLLKPNGLLSYYKDTATTNSLTTQAPGSCDFFLYDAPLLFNHISYAFWEIVRLHHATFAKKQLNTSQYLGFLEWHLWFREFNVNLMPVIQLENFVNCDGALHEDPDILIPPFQFFEKKLVQHWQRQHVTKERMQQISRKDMAQIRHLLLLHYWDICPDALILPYECCNSFGFKETKIEDTFNTRKRPNSFSDLLKSNKRVCSSESTEELRSIQLNSITSDPLCETYVSMQPDKGFSCPHESNQKNLNSDLLLLHYKNVTQLEKEHQATLKFAKNATWLPPVKPHSAFRADNKEIEITYNCSLEMRSNPSSTEWSVVANYTRIFSHELFCGNFDLFLCFLQSNCNSNSINTIACLLDISITNIQIYLDGIKQVTASIANSELRTSFFSEENFLATLPYSQFIFTSFLDQRHIADSTHSSMFHTHILLWNCIPLLLPYIQLLLKFSKPQDEINAKVGNNVKETTLHASSLNFVISITRLPESSLQILINNQFSLDNILEILVNETYKTGLVIQPFSNAPLSLHRPLSMHLSRLFFSKFSFNIIKYVLNSLSPKFSSENFGNKETISQ